MKVILKKDSIAKLRRDVGNYHVVNGREVEWGSGSEFIRNLPLLKNIEYDIKQITFYKKRCPIIYILFNKRQYKLDLKTIGITNYSLKY
jgi:hypothetical protein